VGGHVIKLGPNNDAAAREALAAWTGGLQVGGGISVKNAQEWLDAGASKVIVTSALFPGGKFDEGVLREMCEVVGRDRLVVDIRWVQHWRLGQLGSCVDRDRSCL
jgi:phosphoribosylformimino-5-aminoimidazole carboxamide ribotide isomerase